MLLDLALGLHFCVPLVKGALVGDFSCLHLTQVLELIQETVNLSALDHPAAKENPTRAPCSAGSAAVVLAQGRCRGSRTRIYAEEKPLFLGGGQCQSRMS